MNTKEITSREDIDYNNINYNKNTNRIDHLRLDEYIKNELLKVFREINTDIIQSRDFKKRKIHNKIAPYEGMIPNLEKPKDPGRLELGTPHVKKFKEKVQKTIQNLLETGEHKDALLALQDTLKEYIKQGQALVIDNIPYDEPLPLLYTNPRKTVYEEKQTFFSEMRLETLAYLTGQTTVGYQNRSNGDIYQQVTPVKNLDTSETQNNAIAIKGKKNIGLDIHTDRAYLEMLKIPHCLFLTCNRGSSGNAIDLTCFASTKDILEKLDPVSKEILSQPIFSIEQDQKTIKDGGVSIVKQQILDKHRIIYYRGRIQTHLEGTKYRQEDIDQALKNLDTVIFKVSKHTHLQQGQSLILPHLGSLDDTDPHYGGVHYKITNQKETPVPDENGNIEARRFSKVYTHLNPSGIILEKTDVIIE